MGLIRRIGRRIGRAFRRVVRFAGNVVKGVARGIGGIAKGFMNIAGKVLSHVPFLGAMAGFGAGFLAAPFAMMSPHVLGAMHAMFGHARSPGELAQATRMMSQCHAYHGCPAAPRNMAHMIAYQQARIAFAQTYQNSMNQMGHYA